VGRRGDVRGDMRLRWLPTGHSNGAPPQPDERETGDLPMRSPESSDIRRQMTVPEPEHHAERNLTPLAQVLSPTPSSRRPGGQFLQCPLRLHTSPIGGGPALVVYRGRQ
jgi:hypothetical protein